MKKGRLLVGLWRVTNTEAILDAIDAVRYTLRWSCSFGIFAIRALGGSAVALDDEWDYVDNVYYLKPDQLGIIFRSS